MVDCVKLSFNYEINRNQWLHFTVPATVYAQQVAVIRGYDANEFDRYVAESGWEDWMDCIDEFHKNIMKETIPLDDDMYDEYMAEYTQDEPLEWTLNVLFAIQALMWRDVYGQDWAPLMDPVPLQNRPNTPQEWEWE